MAFRIRAGDLLALDLAVKHNGVGCLLTDIFHHLLGLGMHDLNIHTGSTLNTKTFFIVEIGLADPLPAFVASVEVPLCFILGQLESMLMFPVPFGRHPLESFA